MLNKIKKNFSYLLVSEIIVRALTTIFIILLARQYGPEQFGVYALALSIGGLFDTLFNLGLTTIFLQRVAQDETKIREQLGIFIPLRITLSAALFITFGLFALILQKGLPTFATLIIAAGQFSLFSISIFLWTSFDAQQRMEFTSIIKLITGIIAFIAGIILISINPPIYQVMLTHIVKALAALTITIPLIRKQIGSLSLQWNTHEWKKIIAEGWPIALSGTFILIYTSFDTIIISLTKGEYFVGQYQMSYSIIGTIFILASLINQAHLPALIKNLNTPQLPKIFRANLQSMMFWSIPITIGGLLLSDRIILFIFGPQFAPGIPAFNILIFNCIIFFISSALVNLLYAHKKQRSIMNIFFFGAIANILLNLLVIPRYGIEGASVTTIAAELIVLAGMYQQVRKKIQVPILQSSLKPAIAATIMAVVLSSLFIESLILTTLLGASIYFATYFIILHARKPDISV